MKPDTNQDGNAEKDKRARIQEVQARTDISDAEKARLVQQIMTEGCQWQQEVDEDERDKIYQAGIAAFAPHKNDKEREDLRSSITCQVCLEYVKRPISLACQHSLCLECLRGVRRMDTAQRNCPSCRAPIAISMFESARPSRAGKVVAARAHTDEVEDRPEEAFVTERAKRAGMANACSGALRMTCGPNHFGPIGPEFDPKRSRGVVVGDLYSNRMTCRMECAHLPHVAGIAGRGEVGECCSRDLSGNKRNGDHNGDQTFDRMNLAIKKSCVEGYPVRVVRSCKTAKPKTLLPVRYDGCYRVLACWRVKGIEGFLVCRYLFVRCDNSPAPWSSDDTGDRPRMEIPERAQQEMDAARELSEEVTFMGGSPAWDFNAATGQWGWTRDPPHSSGGGGKGSGEARKKAGGAKPLTKQLEVLCQVCTRVMSSEQRRPVQTPCGHNFCLQCLQGHMVKLEQAAANPAAGRKSRACTQRKPCPKARCGKDLTDFMTSVRANNAVIEAQPPVKVEDQEAAAPAGSDADTVGSDADEEMGEAAVADEKVDGQGRYGHAAVGLAAKFPDFDVAVIEGMLEDQGGDVGEVAAFLRRMARDQAAAARSPKAAAARKPTAGGKRKRKSGGKSKAAKSRADEEAAACEEEEEQQEEEEERDVAAEAEEEAQGDAQEEQAGEEAMEVEVAVAARGRKAAGAGKKRAARAEPSKRRRKAVAA
eukprot:XP_001703545.1 RING finger protein [Chlamydomonas reinhardtii]